MTALHKLAACRKKYITNLTKYIQMIDKKSLKNYILHQLKQFSVLIQAQHTAIAYPPGNKGMK